MLPFPVSHDLFPVEHRFIDLDGARIHYVDEGTGEPVLLLHGNPTWSFLYRKIIAGLSDEFRCIAPDYPGYGMSSAAPGYRYTPAEHSAVIERFVDQLGLSGVTLMVQDWGGPIADDRSTAFILQDVRRTQEILTHPDTRRLINFEEPVAILYISFLHQIPDRDDPAGLVQAMTSHLAPGSFVAMSHLVSADPQLRKQLTDLMLNATEGNWGRVRTRAEVDQFFDGLEPIPPGLVEVTTWRPDDTAAEEQTFNWIEYGVARKPVESP
jgi:hypothetical protein